VTIHKLIYIGEGGNVHDRVSEHEKYKYWKIHVRNGNELCFSCAAVDSDHRVRCEVAMISKHKPPVNEDYLNNFPFDKTTMSLSGETRLLHTYITVERKDN
jgi:predicted GIY-YIG superfamily endonuclease